MNTARPTLYQVLQHYTTAGITLRWHHDGDEYRRGTLLGSLKLSDDETLFIDEGAHGRLGDFTELNLRTTPYLWPLLRRFSDLLKPLPDGSIPAVEIAKLATGKRWADVYDWSQPTFTQQPDKLIITCPKFERWGGRGRGYAEITSKWEVGTIDGHINQVAIIDYLRGHAFALPVNGQQLYEETDFLHIDFSEPTTEPAEDF